MIGHNIKSFFSNFRGDLLGGITAGIVALPLALAFGVSSGLGPSAGLYGAIFISFFAALFGGTSTQISGPTAPMTAVSMVIIANIIAGNDGEVTKALPVILSVFVLAGFIQILLGWIGLGKYIRYIPYPVVSGFMTAIGLIIIITQVLPSLGYYAKDDVDFVNQFKPEAKEVILSNLLLEEKGNDVLVLDDLNRAYKKGVNINEDDIYREASALASKEASGVIGALKVLPRAIKNINFIEFLLALITVLIIYISKKVTTKVPGTLIALIIVSAGAILLQLDYVPIERIPEGIPLPKWEIVTAFDFAVVGGFILPAVTLALLGAIDSLLTSVIADNMTKTRHKPNKELIGQGIGNSIAAIFGGLPGAGATIRTVVNINAGGKTKLSGMISSFMLIFILLGVGPVASRIPAAVLAGILITVGIAVMDYKGLKAIPSLPKDLTFDLKIAKFRFSSEVLILFTVLGLATFWDLVNAVGIGLIIASLIFMKRMGDLTAQRSNMRTLEEKSWKDQVKIPFDIKEKTYIRHLKGPLFFGSTNSFYEFSTQINNDARIVIVRLGRMQYIDQSGVYAMEEMIQELKKREVLVLFVRLLEQPRFMMEQIQMIPNLISNEHIFDSFHDCTYWLESKFKQP